MPRKQDQPGNGVLSGDGAGVPGQQRLPVGVEEVLDDLVCFTLGHQATLWQAAAAGQGCSVTSGGTSTPPPVGSPTPRAAVRIAATCLVLPPAVDHGSTKSWVHFSDSAT